jgi:hypothetical protein
MLPISTVRLHVSLLVNKGMSVYLTFNNKMWLEEMFVTSGRYLSRQTCLFSPLSQNWHCAV